MAIYGTDSRRYCMALLVTSWLVHLVPFLFFISDLHGLPRIQCEGVDLLMGLGVWASLQRAFKNTHKIWN